ncbi:MAG: hypothetical protein ACJ76Y_13525 [Thermoanaerobaculia bacterium]
MCATTAFSRPRIARISGRVRALGGSVLLLVLSGLLSFSSPRPAEACHGTAPPPVCGITGVMVKVTPFVFVVPPNPVNINIPVQVIMACVPSNCAMLGLATATINLVPFNGGAPVATGSVMFQPLGCSANGTTTVVNVPITVPAGTQGLYRAVGTTTVPTTAPNLPPGTVTVFGGDTVVSFVQEAPGQPGVPRLDLKLINPDPSNPFLVAGPGSQVAATYRLVNHDPTYSVTVTLTATSKQNARLPTGNAAVYSISAPQSGDDFPIAFDAPACSIELPADPANFQQPPLTKSVTLAPGETKDVKVSSRSYPKCPSGSCSEQAMLAEGTFSNGDPVEACASTAHVVKVGLANTCCGVVDTSCPHCDMAGPFTNAQGQAYINVTLQDTESGLGFIIPTQQQNISLAGPSLNYGTTSPVVITGTKIDQSQKASVQLTVVDACGNTIICDPVLTDVLRGTGQPVEQTNPGLPPSERYVAITNGAPGLRSLEVIVNGEVYHVNGMRDGEERTLDVGPSMFPGNANAITLRATGKPGSTATVIIRDQP